MRSVRNLIGVAGLVALSALLGGCSSGGGATDPSEDALRPTGVVRGTVTSSVDEAPLPNALIVISSIPFAVGGGVAEGGVIVKEARTNEFGEYRFEGAQIGQLRVLAWAPGFQTSAPTAWALATAGEAVLDFELSPGAGAKPDGSAFSPDDGDGQNGFPYDYNGEFFTNKPDDG